MPLRRLAPLDQPEFWSIFASNLDPGDAERVDTGAGVVVEHTGFNVFCGNRISPNDGTAMDNLARYIIRASFSQERMQ